MKRQTGSRATRVQRMLSAIAASGILLLSSTWAAAESGMVTTKDNHVFIGDIDTKTEAGHTQITSPQGVVSIDSRNVSKVTFFTNPNDEFAARWAHTDRKDVASWEALAQFAADHQMYDEARHALLRVIEIDPSNRQAADMLHVMDQKVAAANPPPPPTTIPAVETPAVKPDATRIRRELTADEVNHIRQLEWQASDPGMRVTIPGDVKTKAVAAQLIDPARVSQMSAPELAWVIVHHGTDAMRNAVRLQTNPATIQNYKQQVHRFVVTSCATGACHNTEKAGRLRLFPEETDAAVVTNFVILQQYLETVNGVEYNLVDRTHPAESLLLQFAMPVAAATVPHPKGPGYTAPVRVTNLQLQSTLQWIKTLSPIQPTYDVDLTVDVKKAEKPHAP